MSEIEEKEYDNGSFIGEHKYCIADEVISNGSKRNLRNCASSDALCVYEHEADDGEVWYDAFCRSCNQVFFKDELYKTSLGHDLGVSEDTGVVVDRKKFKLQKQLPPLTRQQAIDFIKATGYKSGNYRGIKDEYSKFFGHLTKLDSKGKVIARFYPETEEGVLNPVGYKCRNHPKDFRYGKLGKTGVSNQLSGQTKFNAGGKYLLIVGGEEDKAAAFQMLRENQLARGQGEFSPVAVVSPTTGEGSTARQVAAQYEWCNTFDNIIIGMDNDKAGKEAAKTLAMVLPADKVKIASWTGKDPNKMLELNMSSQFVRDFYGAKEYVASGILSSSDLDDLIEKELMVKKLPLPKFMEVLQRKMAGGIPLGYIVNITAETGRGKTSIVNEMINFWIFNSPHLMGIVSLELTAGQYGQAMLSRHLGKKLSLFVEGQDAVDFINTPEAKEARKRLWTDDYGQDRFYLLDDRDGTLMEAQRQCEVLIKKYDCKFLVLDPLQDLLDGSSFEEQAVFMKWQKQVIKGGITFININHTRKTGGQSKDKDGNILMRELGDDDIMGTSAIAKSGGANIYVVRDVFSDDPIVQNTSYVTASKIRWTGESGQCGKWYYERDTHTLHDFDTFFSGQSSPETPKRIETNE